MGLKEGGEGRGGEGRGGEGRGGEGRGGEGRGGEEGGEGAGSTCCIFNFHSGSFYSQYGPIGSHGEPSIELFHILNHGIVQNRH